MLHRDGTYPMAITLPYRKRESAQKTSKQLSWGISARFAHYSPSPPPFPTSNPFFLLYQDYSTWWYNIRIKIWLISYRLIFHDIFSTSHFKTSVGGYLRRLENLGSWHELGTNLFFCASETSYPYYFTNRVKMKKHLLATSVLLFP